MRKALLALLISPGLVACGTTCPEIAKHRDDFSRQLTRPAGGVLAPDDVVASADMQLTLPYRLLDELIASQLKKRPIEVSLPTSKLGLDLALTVVLDGVETHAIRNGQSADGIGVTLRLGLFKGRERALDMTIDGSFAPTLVAETGQKDAPSIALSLDAERLGRLEPKTTPEGRAMLSRWLESELPPYLRALGSRQVIDGLADEILGWLTREVWPLVKTDLAKDGPLFAASLALPELTRFGLRELATRSHRDGVRLHLVSGVRAPPLPSANERIHPERLVLRLSGKTATALISQAMDRGEVPGRFAASGEPDTDGPWDARVGWLGGSRPLQLHLWRVRDVCERAEVGARVAVQMQGEALDVDVREGRLLSVAGPPFAEAFAWLDNLFGKAIAFSFSTDAILRFDTRSEELSVRVAKVTLERDFRIELEVDQGR